MGGGVSVPACTTGHMTGGGLCPGGSLSGGSLSRGGVSVWGVSVRETPPYGNERAVLILLECILVIQYGCLELAFHVQILRTISLLYYNKEAYDLP